MANLLLITGFLVCTSLILFCGYRLSKYGDMMAVMLGWGKMFFGLIMMAAVTSLPEMMTGIGSVLIVSAPNLAVGDIVGSCAFNILIISIMDLFYDKKKPLTSVAQTGHVIAASFGIIMLCSVALAMIIPEVFPTIGWIGGYSILFLALYVVSLRIIYLYEKKQPAKKYEQPPHKLSLRKVITLYAINAAVVMISAMALPYFGERLAEKAGISEGFFGALFIAISTSLPEIVVSVSAIRLGSIDLAIGNIFGSNIFNIGILVLDDVLFFKGPLFSYTSISHIIPVIGTIIITAIGIIGIVYREEKKWKLALDTIMISLVYLLIMVLLYQKSNVA